MSSTVHTDPKEKNVGLDLDLLQLNLRLICERVDEARSGLHSEAQVFAIESSARRDIAQLRSIARRLAEESEDLGYRQVARDIVIQFEELDHEILATQRHNA